VNVRGETVAILSVEPDRTTYATGDGRRLELQDEVTLIRKDSMVLCQDLVQIKMRSSAC